MLDIKITKATTLKEKPIDESTLGFGSIFTDHMFVMDYIAGEGWIDPRIEPYHSFSIDPSCNVLHYAQEVFEGMKAYRTPDGYIQLFRPACNAERMQKSCDRLCMPKVDVDDFLQACLTLVELEKDWVPHSEGTSLYIRPFMFASANGLGVHASTKYTFCIILSPSGSYFKNGLAATRIYVEDDYIRAAPGLTGFAKCGGNYAASIKSGELANKLGYDQVLWLDGVHKKYVEEVGAMNIFFKIDGKLYTAACTGTVLNGVTRRSIIDLAREDGYEVIEGPLAIEDVVKAGKEGKLEEVFGTGTAAVVAPVKELKYRDDVIYIGDGNIGPLTKKFYDTLTSIQKGESPLHPEWITKVCKG